MEGQWLAVLQLLSQEAARSWGVTPGPWQGGEMARVLVSLGDGTDDGVPASPQKLSFVLVVLAKRNAARKLKLRIRGLVEAAVKPRG